MVIPYYTPLYPGVGYTYVAVGKEENLTFSMGPILLGAQRPTILVMAVEARSAQYLAVSVP